MLESIIQQAMTFFASTPLHALPPDESFSGAGVYGLYLIEHGDFYQQIADSTAERPIYVGKAVPVGWRTARTSDSSTGRELFQRLREHASSIAQAQNLTTAQFRVRFMLLSENEGDLIVPVEAELIRRYKPLWNVSIDGFGNHDPGSGRYAQSISEWDTLHPGRPWAARLTGEQPHRAAILAKIANYQSGGS